MGQYKTAAQLPVDLKKVKEEILSTAWKETPPAAQVQERDGMDLFIEHYLLLHFNPGSRAMLRATPQDALNVLRLIAQRDKPGAEISQEQVKSILLKHAAPTAQP